MTNEKMGTAQKQKTARSWPLLSIFAVVCAAAFGLVFLSLSGEGPSPSAASIGGPFSLVDTSGDHVRDETFRGKLMLVMFGYTYCPDVCPTELQTVAQALEKLGVQAQDVAPLFISLDPERDTPEKLKNYLDVFGGKIRGLTGTGQQISEVSKSYRVYFKKSSKNPSDKDYAIDHSAIIYLMDRQGHYLTHFTFDTSAETMADILRKYIAATKTS